MKRSNKCKIQSHIMLRVFIHLMILRAMTNISAGNRENNFWSERVRAPAVGLHTLVENVVATINTIIFSLSLSLSPPPLLFYQKGLS